MNSFVYSGQANLLNSSVLVVGAGGLGSPALLYLAACGLGISFNFNFFLKIIHCFLIIIAAACILFDDHALFGYIHIAGRLGIVDHDVVELNNLHRQV